MEWKRDKLHISQDVATGEEAIKLAAIRLWSKLLIIAEIKDIYDK